MFHSKSVFRIYCAFSWNLKRSIIPQFQFEQFLSRCFQPLIISKFLFLLSLSLPTKAFQNSRVVQKLSPAELLFCPPPFHQSQWFVGRGTDLTMAAGSGVIKKCQWSRRWKSVQAQLKHLAILLLHPFRPFRLININLKTTNKDSKQI